MKYSNLRSFRSLVEAWFAREVVQPISVEEAEAQDAAIKNGLAGVTPEVLVRAVFNSSSSEEALVEAENRLAKSPLANRFAFRFLVGWRKQEAGPLTAGDEADLGDAVDGLRGCCFTAIGDWSVPGDRPTLIYNRETERLVRTDRRVTAGFIEDRLLAELEKYRKLSPQALLTAALESQFKNLPRAVKYDFIDEFDKSNTDKAQVLRFSTYGIDPTSVEDTRLKATCHIVYPDSQPDATPDRVIEVLALCRDELIEELGETSYETLVVIADCRRNDDVPDSRQGRKSWFTAEIGRTLGLSGRQSSERKRQLWTAMRRAQRNGNPIVTTLYELLAGPPIAPTRRRPGVEPEEAAEEAAEPEQEELIELPSGTEREPLTDDSAVFEEISE
jgi:hypothetical protein